MQTQHVFDDGDMVAFTWEAEQEIWGWPSSTWEDMSKT